MGNISAKINLRQLQSAVRTMKGKSGDIECLVIPIAGNNLIKGEKGVYLDLIGFELKEKIGDRKDTHLVKQSLPKEVTEKMSDEQKHAMPILGNMVLWGFQEPAPNNVEVGEVSAEDMDGDLPF
ncbi:hypothetical protein [Mangrovibacterium sp.]|uniref:hypothetical protein n=1 Tax=Mangrovibacterium sp. TaxID=1961364 RepID=UPI0035627BC3